MSTLFQDTLGKDQNGHFSDTDSVDENFVLIYDTDGEEERLGEIEEGIEEEEDFGPTYDTDGEEDFIEEVEEDDVTNVGSYVENTLGLEK